MRALLLTGSPTTTLAPACCLGLQGSTEATADDTEVRGCIDAARAAGVTALTLTGGEVLARPEALDWLHAASEAGFRAVEVRTSGRLLAMPAAAERVVAAGATHVGVELLGGDAATHDLLAGQPGAFSRAIRALRNCRAAGAATRIVAPLLRPSYGGLSAMVRRTLPLGVGGFDFVAIPGPDRAAHPLLPHPALAAAQVRAALTLVRAARRRGTTMAMAACLLAGEADAAIERGAPLFFDAAASGAGPIPNHFRRQHGSPCERCVLTASCAGPMADEVARHGWAHYQASPYPMPAAADGSSPDHS